MTIIYEDAWTFLPLSSASSSTWGRQRLETTKNCLQVFSLFIFVWSLHFVLGRVSDFQVCCVGFDHAKRQVVSCFLCSAKTGYASGRIVEEAQKKSRPT